MRNILASLVVFLATACSSVIPAQAANTSSINPTQPANGSQMTSAPIRNNFLAAYNDINAIWTQLAGLGTMARQDAGTVAITGGSIDNTTIGYNTPATGYFISLITSGAGTVNFAHDGDVNFNNTGSVAILGPSTFNLESQFANLNPYDGMNISPSGPLSISPANLEILPYSTVGTMDKVNVGQTTPGLGKFTKLETTYRGTFTANGTSAVAVSDTHVTANSEFVYGLKTVGGTPACKPYESAVTVGSGFSVKACAGDTSVYNYAIHN